MPDLQQRIYELVWAKVKDRSEVGNPWKLADARLSMKRPNAPR